TGIGVSANIIGCKDSGVRGVKRNRVPGNLDAENLAFGQIASPGGSHPALNRLSHRPSSPPLQGRATAADVKGTPEGGRQSRRLSKPEVRVLRGGAGRLSDTAFRSTRSRLAPACCLRSGADPGATGEPRWRLSGEEHRVRGRAGGRRNDWCRA